MTHNPEGTHVLAEMTGCSAALLSDGYSLVSLMSSCAAGGGATVISGNFHKFMPTGITAFLILAESHFTMHSYEEHDGLVIADCYTCGTTADPVSILRDFSSSLGARSVSYKVIKRGVASKHGYISTTY